MKSSIPEVRFRKVNQGHVRPDGEFVLYWMTAFRRPFHNFSLQRAVEWAVELKKPLMILEALRCDYPWAGDRLHAFVLNGMRDNLKSFTSRPVTYYPYLEDSPSAGKGLLEALGAMACFVVTDDCPAFFLPRMLRSAANRLEVGMEAADSNGILPMRTAEQVFNTAHAFRRFLQRHLPEHLGEFPFADPLADIELPGLTGIPHAIVSRWPAASADLLRGAPDDLARLPLDHSVGVVNATGGFRAAVEKLGSFVNHQLSVYHEERNHPDAEVGSGLSPYLHFGHVSSHEIVRAVLDQEEWTPDLLVQKASGQRSGWWGMSEGAEAFLDQVITWRELGFNMCSRVEDHDRLDSLPEWALKELTNHARDPRPHLYSLDQFEAARTHDTLWNCAQTQLLREGVIHNYLRMLWGKKILEWSSTPGEALTTMIELNNKYALDGRDPNSYTGIFWILGRYDRPWFPERPVFGRIRFMSSASTMRKIRLRDYMVRYGEKS
jgi:deoxyribodipyrimidine photo-lyase